VGCEAFCPAIFYRRGFQVIDHHITIGAPSRIDGPSSRLVAFPSAVWEVPNLNPSFARQSVKSRLVIGLARTALNREPTPPGSAVFCAVTAASCLCS
jgi:hypothetical protein